MLMFFPFINKETNKTKCFEKVKCIKKKKLPLHRHFIEREYVHVCTKRSKLR